MANEKLISELREMANRTPPICTKDKPEDVVLFGKAITVYCKPFEQFQELLVRAADALEVDAVEVVHGRWEKTEYNGFLRCSECKDVYINEEWLEDGKWNYCPNCGADMRGKEDA